MKFITTCLYGITLMLVFGSCGSKTDATPDSITNATDSHEVVDEYTDTQCVETADIEMSDDALTAQQALTDSEGADASHDSRANEADVSTQHNEQDLMGMMMGMIDMAFGSGDIPADPDELMKIALAMLGQAAEQRQQQERLHNELPNGWRDWPTEEVAGIYVKISAWDEDEAASISRDYYDGAYIHDGWSYYARTSIMGGQYPITIGSEQTSRLFHIKGSEYYIYFDWPCDVETGDMGVYDNTGFFECFYKKPGA